MMTPSAKIYWVGSDDEKYISIDDYVDRDGTLLFPPQEKHQSLVNWSYLEKSHSNISK